MKVSEGCRNCYAEKMSRRMAAIADATVDRGLVPSTKMNSYTRVVKYKNDYPLAQWSNRVVCIDDALDVPMKVCKPTTWFVNSMSDLFHPDVSDSFQFAVFMTMAKCPQHTFQILTKRPEIMCERLAKWSNDRVTFRSGITMPMPLPNVWLGTSIENQETADERIPHLLKCPAAVRFLSCEPLLGPIDITGYPHMFLGWSKIDWVIVGGESGPGARPFNIDWARSLRDQCRNTCVPFYMKQLGAKPRYCGALKSYPLKLKSRKGNDMAEWPADLRVREMPGVKKLKGGE